jgi:hypothetical protein
VKTPLLRRIISKEDIARHLVFESATMPSSHLANIGKAFTRHTERENAKRKGKAGHRIIVLSPYRGKRIKPFLGATKKWSSHYSFSLAPPRKR